MVEEAKELPSDANLVKQQSEHEGESAAVVEALCGEDDGRDPVEEGEGDGPA